MRLDKQAGVGVNYFGVIASMFGASEAGAVLSGAGTAVMVLGLVSYLFEVEKP